MTACTIGICQAHTSQKKEGPMAPQWYSSLLILVIKKRSTRLFLVEVRDTEVDLAHAFARGGGGSAKPSGE